MQNYPVCRLRKTKVMGEKQAEHVKLMNFMRDEINGNTNWKAITNKVEWICELNFPVYFDFILLSINAFHQVVYNS